MSLIDLDRPAERPARPERPGPWWRPTRPVVVALVLGALLGGVATDRWTVRHQRDADGRTASVLLFADTQASEIGVLVVASTGPDRPRRVTFHAAIAVVNAGPRPFRVRSLTAQKAGMTVAGSGGWQAVASRTSSLVDVDVEATCVAEQNGRMTTVSVGGGSLPAVVSVETESGPDQSITGITLDTTPWAAQWQGAAEKCMESWPRGSGY